MTLLTIHCLKSTEIIRNHRINYTHMEDMDLPEIHPCHDIVVKLEIQAKKGNCRLILTSGMTDIVKLYLSRFDMTSICQQTDQR